MGLNRIERACVSAFRKEGYPDRSDAVNESELWLLFGVSALFLAGRAIRAMHQMSLDVLVRFKEDGSPATPQEAQVERDVRELLTRFQLNGSVVGEETGGEIQSTGYTVAIDPVDGTWSLLNRTENHTTSLAIFENGEVMIGMVLNPSTGELGYSVRGGLARLLQLSVFGEDDLSCNLPVDLRDGDTVLVNVHPRRDGGELVSTLYQSWGRQGLQMVRSPGGSPSWGFLEAAKGSFTYLNAWSDEPAGLYDLAPGVMLVRGAGGDVTDLAGRSINLNDHTGPFVAGIHKYARERVAALACSALAKTKGGI